MALSTFGAIMGFAAEMVGHARATYETLAGAARDPALKAVLEQLASDEQKNHASMERARREHVTEMILEPVTGLFRKDYELSIDQAEQKSDPEILKTALALEIREKKFFDDASAKVPLPEVARIFRKTAKKKEENIARLEGLGFAVS